MTDSHDRDDDDKPSPGNPPKKSRWKKGDPSPNPKGRPRKREFIAPDLKKLFEEAAFKEVRITQGDRTVLLTRVEMTFENLLNQAAKGCRYARRDFFDVAQKLNVDLTGQAQRVAEALAPGHQEILDAFVKRQQPQSSETERVLAPDDLTDDDLDPEDKT